MLNPNLEEEMMLAQWNKFHRLSFTFHAIGRDALSYGLAKGQVNSRNGLVRLTNNSGSTSISGIALLNFISCFVTVRQFFTISICFLRLYDLTVPFSAAALEVNITLDCGTNG